MSFYKMSFENLFSFCSQTPVSGVLPPNPHQGFYAWTLLGDFRPWYKLAKTLITVINQVKIHC